MAGNAMLSTMEKILETREKNPNTFLRRLTEKEGNKRTPYSPTSSDNSVNEQKAQENAKKLENLTEDVDNNDEDGFANWKGQVYNFAKILYGIDQKTISPEMLNFKWSQGIQPRELVMQLARKYGLEQLQDPEDFV